MAFYIVTRTDVVETEEYDALIVRASGRKQALEQVTGGAIGAPFEGFKADGSNARVERLADGRDTDSRVVLASYVAE